MRATFILLLLLILLIINNFFFLFFIAAPTFFLYYDFFLFACAENVSFSATAHGCSATKIFAWNERTNELLSPCQLGDKRGGFASAAEGVGEGLQAGHGGERGQAAEASARRQGEAVWKMGTALTRGSGPN